jgi:hypothetical protein
MSDGIGLAEALLGLPGFRVLEVHESVDELVVTVESTVTVAWCVLLGLRVGDPNDEVLGAWLAKESVRDIYLTERVREAPVLLDKAIRGCLADDVPEIQSLGRTLAAWRTEILNHHRTGASNGPTEGLNLCVKKVNAAGTGPAASSTTASACSSTPVASPGPRAHHRPASEPT